ncbi:Sodium-independent sulfate anion transporter [Cryptotermes secundus]|uniref:Sodium-independent sulfate anion transporter n=3 Tax=Cryptotermes secundus TaxID=105785 RepID=A0A2J7QAB9_9NEOP|nr:sodium-independent sulfate anion transporter isoform X3 [Cryptotermes secundus]XP_023715577.1 sodium-independent sulfate anion transporter isoform X3 [Cryptotermes secundus]XP_023715578.1 sodium-independent sulfate anion transporter isoform X3 [Cryptotermes secundus]XP_023715579.1 sodium-independent sulfate anion transporter isoform X3 [Cryptotermes secundus]XP_033609060.1 sodium-independent sulfate anion transporter isoform X3 [Cryptotermes secundus]XP_033609061.1 sodium-independent sulfat
MSLSTSIGNSENNHATWMKRLKTSLYRCVPILSWMPLYNADKFICDLIAGVTVGLTVIPQSLAYATLAGLEPQYGLYSAFVGCFVYVVFGSCKDITIGPTALMALMTYQQVIGRNADFAILLCFLTGCVQLLMAILHLGVLVDFISIPVTVGFTSATSVIIACSQLKGLLGLSFKSNGFLDTVNKVWTHIPKTRPWDATLGFTCIVVLLLLRKIKDIKLGPKDGKPNKRQKTIMKTLWLISTARNVFVVVVCSFIAYNLHAENEDSPFILTGTVRSGLPSFGLPPFGTNLGNQTYSFADMCSELGSSIVLVPIIGVLGNVAIAKAFSSGDSVDATQELLTLGICNLLGSFASSFPVTGSFSRSAVNHASGVMTPFGGFYTGVLILLALGLLTPYFYFIPKASLAAVIICAVVFMIEYEVVKPMWKSSRKDLIPTFVTFITCLVIAVEYGIIIGVGINLVFLLYPSARPTIHVEKSTTHSGVEYLLVTPANSLYFPAVDFIRTSVGKAAVKQGLSHLPVIIDCRFILGADFTAAKGIAALIEDFNKRKQPIYFYNPQPSVISVFKGASLEEFVHFCSQEELDFILQSFSNNQQHTKGTEPEQRRLLVEMNDFLPFESPFNGGVPCKSAENSSNVCKSRNNLNDSSTPLLEKSGSAPEVTKV